MTFIYHFDINGTFAHTSQQKLTASKLRNPSAISLVSRDISELKNSIRINPWKKHILFMCLNEFCEWIYHMSLKCDPRYRFQMQMNVFVSKFLSRFNSLLFVISCDPYHCKRNNTYISFLICLVNINPNVNISVF